MTTITLEQKLAILSDAAKYDASCASSGGERRSSLDGKGLGSSGGSGICHAYAPDGRCISLLKILMTNFCIYDCVYCVNRVSSQVDRARFTVEEVVRLTIEFYRRNYIEGLFLSSGIIRSPDDTMADMVRIARTLREVENFRGYIHLKTIPDASPELLDEAGKWAERLSINVEMPTADGLKRLAPEKSATGIRKTMAAVRRRREATREVTHTGRRKARFAPAGQSTQMIVGADASDDGTILTQASQLYAGYGLSRVYYSAFSPFHALVRALAQPQERTAEVSCNILGATALGFRHRDDVAEITRLLTQMGVAVNVAAPLDASPEDLKRLPAAHFNVLLYPETGESAARWLEKTHAQPWTKTIPIGAQATREFIAETAAWPVTMLSIWT